MKPEELLFRLEQASNNLMLRMEWQTIAFSEKLAGLIERVSHSAAGDRYREVAAVVKEILIRIALAVKERAAQSEHISILKEIAKTHLKLLARRLSVMSPYVHKALENRLAIAYISLLIGFLGGKYWISGYPQLKPLQMMSVVCGSYSGPDGLALCRIEMPRVQCNDEVLIKVMSAGLDRSDLLAVSGWGKVERGKVYGGFSIGRDFCGVVVEAGIGVSHLHPGDRVWGAVPYNLAGTLSEQVVVKGNMAQRMPTNLNWEGAATVPYSALQVWRALVWNGGLKPDQAAGVSVLVVDGVTDTGCLAVQLACMWGANVTVLCPARTVPLAHALGAHIVVAAQDEIDECIQDLRESGPFDLIVHSGDLLPKSSISSLLTPSGKCTTTLPTSLSSDGWGRLRRMFHPLWRSLFSTPNIPPSSKICEPLIYVTSAVQSGKLQPVLDTVLSPQEVGAALSRLATQDIVGKSVVLFDRI